MASVVKIAEVVGSGFCLSNEDGHKVYDQVFDILKQDMIVTISFEGVKRTTTAFLNVAIGQLYSEFDEEFIRKHLKVEDADATRLQQLKRVVEGAKLFFTSRDTHKSIQDLVHDG